MKIPSDAKEYVRGAFGSANDAASRLISTQPFTHEETLDQVLIAQLTGYAAPHQLGSGALVTIHTHFIGGRRHFLNWEVADIGIFMEYRVRGRRIKTKVVLFQSKRLYAKEILHRDEARPDHYMQGISRLLLENEDYDRLTSQRDFTFNDKCLYREIEKGNDQMQVMEEYVKQSNIPIHYLLYNPLEMPWQVSLPVSQSQTQNNEVGARVISRELVRNALSNSNKNASPSFGALFRPSDRQGKRNVGGLSLQDYLVDQVLECHDGYVAPPEGDDTLGRLFFARSGPIAAAVAVSIDVPED